MGAGMFGDVAVKERRAKMINWWQDPFHRAVVYCAALILAAFAIAMAVGN
jgi:hypothetical protein